jgi:hypothetical protein
VTAAVTPPARAALASEVIEPPHPDATTAPLQPLPAAASPEPEPEPTPAPAPAPSEDFLAARDRAAAHGSRSH